MVRDIASKNNESVKIFPKEWRLKTIFLERIGIFFLYHHANIFDIGIGSCPIRIRTSK